MPLKVVQARTNQDLWDACAGAFLDAAAATPGPAGQEAWLWLSNRSLRDALYDRARNRGIEGWLLPPITLVASLPELFGIHDRPVGILTRRRLLSRLAGRIGREVMGREPGRSDGVIRGHMLDGLLSELLPEGVAPGELRDALDTLGGDEFARLRNRWIVDVYDAYLEALRERGLHDWRQNNARMAEAIENGELPELLGGATTLHIYGIVNPRARRRFFRALADQAEVEVILYLPDEPEVAELEGLAARVELEPGPDTEDSGASPPIQVQPTPDSTREMQWVAREIKKLLHGGDAEPHDVAVIARSGREDTRRAYRALEQAGVPATARIRTPLLEISALRALLLVFKGAASDWDYRSLRAFLAHPYFDTRIDLRSIDFIARNRRVEGLAAWEEKLERLLDLVKEEDRSTWGAGLFADRVENDLEAFRELRVELDPLTEPRTEAGWLEATLSLLKKDRGLRHFRRRVCDPVAERWDVVRLDQRGIVQLERLLAEWRDLDHPEDPLEPGDWHALLRRLLEANELMLSTPGQKGVQVLEAHDAALVPFRHTFVVHANDGEFPRAARTTGILSDDERVRLRVELGLPVSHREESLRRERTLWRAVTRQDGGVRASYRTADPGGTPLLPSLMVPSHDPADELPRTRRPEEGAEATSPAEADRLAADRLAGVMSGSVAKGRRQPGGPGSPGDPTGPGIVVESASGPARIPVTRPDRLRQAVVAAVAETHRGPGWERAARAPDHPALRPSPWNGEIRDPEVLAWLAGRFDETYPWSASQLETYARCPFVFLVDRVLRLKGVEEVEEETPPLTFGSVAHEILEGFYSRAKDDLPACLEGPADELLDEICDEVFARRESEGEWLGTPVLWAVTREEIRARVREYLAWELPHMQEKNERPHLVEESFGFDGEEFFVEGEDLAGKRRRLRIRGRVDRVDEVGVKKIRYDILDYKTSAIPSRSGYTDGSTVQAVLYMEALAGRGLDVRRGRYRAIKKPGSPQNGAALARTQDDYETALRIAFSMPERVRRGLFEPVVASSSRWQPWDMGPEIRRTDAKLDDGHRFEAPAERATSDPEPAGPGASSRRAGEGEREGDGEGEGDAEGERADA